MTKGGKVECCSLPVANAVVSHIVTAPHSCSKHLHLGLLPPPGSPQRPQSEVNRVARHVEPPVSCGWRGRQPSVIRSNTNFATKSCSGSRPSQHVLFLRLVHGHGSPSSWHVLLSPSCFVAKAPSRPFIVRREESGDQ